MRHDRAMRDQFHFVLLRSSNWPCRVLRRGRIVFRALHISGLLDGMPMEFLVVAFKSDSCFAKVDRHRSYVPFLNAFSSFASEEPHCLIRLNKGVSDVLINRCSSLNHISKPETSDCGSKQPEYEDP